MNDDEVVKQILQAAGKHPNSRVSKLIHSVQEEQTQKNIVLLLIELAEHSEYATDFSISLRYYLDLFNNLGIGYDIVLNEAGLFLLNASKIYAKRVDYVHELVGRQILTISNADSEVERGKKDNQDNAVATAVKEKRGRKRLLEAPNDPFEIEMAPKKFRKLSDEKRFSINKPTTKPLLLNNNNNDGEQHLHPACWLHSRILDLDNDENIDTKRNYKLFTYHVEHRYNTLVPDINFRLHFKVKDYLDQEEDDRQDGELFNGNEANSGFIERARDEVWPPLSDEYIQKYLRLENHVLEQECSSSTPKRRRIRRNTAEVIADSALNETQTGLNNSNNVDLNQTALEQVQNSKLSNSDTFNESDDSAVGNSLHDNSTIEPEKSETNQSNINGTNISDNSTINDISAIENTSTSEHSISQTNDSGISETITEVNSTTNTKNEENISTTQASEIRVHLSHLDDEGVFFSELDERDVRMLSPTVVATDVFPSIPNKENLTIIVDDEIKALLNLEDDEPSETLNSSSAEQQPIILNIMKIHEKFLRRRVLFKLGREFDIFKQTRLLKRVRFKEPPVSRQRVLKFTSLKDTDMTGVPMTPPPSPGRFSDNDFNGFSDDEYDETGNFLGFTDDSIDACKRSRLSRDSGVGTDMSITANSTNNVDTISEECSIQNDAISADQNAIEMNSPDKTQSDAIDSPKDTTPTHDSSTENNSETCSAGEATQAQDAFNDFLSELETNNSKTKIQKWHEHLQPILAKSRERHHFDVFQLGTEIIEKFDTPSPSPNSGTVSGDASNSKTFQDIMEEKEPSYVSRYFLSTLLLANQGNITINVQNKSTEEPTAWSDVQLKLVNTKRHTVAIEDNIGIIPNSSTKRTASVTKTITTACKSISQPVKNKKLKLNLATSTPTHALLTPPETPTFAATTPITCSLSNMDDALAMNFTSNNSNNICNVNLSGVRPLKPIEKVPYINDDVDSGIFSREELAL